MQKLISRSILSACDVKYVAIALLERTKGQRHTGIFFRVVESDDLELLHLAWHCVLQRDPTPASDYLKVAPSINHLRLRQVAALCDDIASANEKEQIPYSFGSPIEAFDPDTKKFLIGPTHTGLTCASFVLAVFEAAGLPLVAASGWPPPDKEDIRWQASVLDSLRNKSTATQEHIKAVEQEVGTSVRYRPEQVAGSSAIRSKKPVKYRQAKIIGDGVLSHVRGESINPKHCLTYGDWFLRLIGLQ
jgi:hypothetical protein